MMFALKFYGFIVLLKAVFFPLFFLALRYHDKKAPPCSKSLPPIPNVGTRGVKPKSPTRLTLVK